MKKFKFSIEVIKIFMHNQIQDKSNLFLDMFNMFSRCFIVFLLYAYIFKLKGGVVNGVDYKTTMYSMFIYFCIMILNIRRIDQLIMNDVKSGSVELYMNKPVSYLFITFYKTIGKGLSSFLIISIIGTILMITCLGVPNLNLSIFIPSFIITLILGQILGLIIYSIVGIASFFIVDNRPIHWIVDKFVMILGGSYLPISMFPPLMKKLAYISPFGAINFATSTVYDSWNYEFIKRIGLQIIWILVFVFILNIIYKKAKEKTMINGG